MTQRDKPQDSRRPRPRKQLSAASERTDARISLSKVLFVKDGQTELKIPRGVLPEFIVKANTAVNRGHIAEATKLFNDDNVEEACRMADENQPQADIIYLMLALIFYKTRQLKKAEKWYKKILKHQQNAFVLNELGCIYQDMGRVFDAMECRKKAVQIDPTHTGISANYAADLMRTRKMHEGITFLQKTLEANPTNVVIRSNLLWFLHYLPDTDPEMLFDEHKTWGRIHAPLSLAKTSHENNPDPDRRLRIAYISPDFRRHSAAYNFEPFLSGRDPHAVEVYGYGNVAKPDEMTERLKRQFDHYRDIRELDDKTVAGMIERDKIDILVEIGGHSGDNRLLVLAYKPAPIQVDYGGINTSGMEQIDYRFTDTLLDSPETEKLYVEELVYLPGGLFCYSPFDPAPPVTHPPAFRKGHITFGSFNGSLKINPYIMSLWAQVLNANEGSCFFLKFPAARDPMIKDYFFQEFERLGISRERVEIHGWKRIGAHLKLYGDVDIVLDTYPFNGCITTLEGLWMGVPVISLAGKRHSFLSRVGRSILSRLDMDFFATSTPDEYVAKATALAANLDALAKIRVSMRQRLAASVLCDAKAYAGSVEAAYRKMWHRWCRSHGGNVANDQLRPEEESTDAEVSVHSC